jgi:hypothetical protein
MKVSYNQLKNQVKRGYLPPNFIEKLRNCNYLIETTAGEIVLNSECIYTREGHYCHVTEDKDVIYCIDELATTRRKYILMENSVQAYGSNQELFTTYIADAYIYREEYYHRDYLSENNLVRTYEGDISHIDDVFYWNSDGEYHLEEEPDQDDNVIYGYDCGIREKDFTHEDIEETTAPIFGFGIEIEKNELPTFEFNRRLLYEETGAVIERDGSVSQGFELKTPIYNLLSTKTDERIKALKSYCDIQNVQNAGGHIGFSCKGLNDIQLLDAVRGFLPLIYAMHKKRLTNTYCRAKRVSRLKAEKYEKMQSIRLRDNYIEFRIFSSVKNFDTLLFRLELFRIIAQNLNAPFGKVIGMCINPEHPLHNLLANRIYKNSAKFTRLVTDAIEIDKNLGQGRIKPESIVKIQEKIISIFEPKNADNTKVKENGKEAQETQENALPSAPMQTISII